MSENPVVKLIRQHGVGGLGGYDGCHCTSFALHQIKVQISCRKGNGGLPSSVLDGPYFAGTVIRVYTHSSDPMPSDLVEVAEAIVADLDDEHTPTIVRFCDWKQDQEQTCLYCAEPRADALGYLCDRCKGGKTSFGEVIADRYAFPDLRWNFEP